MKHKIDIKYINVPNICFSLTDKDDKREQKFKKQRIKRGFDDSETWSLRDTIANFIIPRLKRYIEIKSAIAGCFKSEKEEKKVLKKILKSFELVQRDNGSFILTDKELKQYEKGMKLFEKYFLTLWW